MKRIAVIAVAAALFATTGAVAIAADPDPDPSETRVLTESQLWRTTLLAGYFAGRFEVSTDQITKLRTGDTVIGTPIGWGAMFKLLQLAEGGNLSALLVEIADDERGWAFGYRFKNLNENHPYWSDEGAPRNLGQLKKQNREPRGNQG